jgi:hypothetical protein
MVHIKNWESITDTNVDGIDVNSASIIYNPTLMDMLGLRCTPEKIYHIRTNVELKMVDKLWMQKIFIDAIIFPLSNSMQIGIAKSGKECQMITPVTYGSLNTPEEFLKFLKNTIDNSILLLNNNH